MKNVKVVLNSAGIRDLLHSRGIESAILEAGNSVQQRAGENFGTVIYRMKTRSVVRVSAINAEGRKENRDDNVLLKALH